MLSKRQLINVCLVGEFNHKRCRYLVRDDKDHTKYYCMKLTNEAKEIDAKLERARDGYMKRGINPNVSNIAGGDNCAGYIYLKTIEQGYDKD